MARVEIYWKVSSDLPNTEVSGITLTIWFILILGHPFLGVHMGQLFMTTSCGKKLISIPYHVHLRSKLNCFPVNSLGSMLVTTEMPA